LNGCCRFAPVHDHSLHLIGISTLKAHPIPPSPRLRYHHLMTLPNDLALYPQGHRCYRLETLPTTAIDHRCYLLVTASRPKYCFIQHLFVQSESVTWGMICLCPFFIKLAGVKFEKRNYLGGINTKIFRQLFHCVRIFRRENGA